MKLNDIPVCMDLTFTAAPSVKKLSFDEQFDQDTRLVFLFDASSSMTWRLAQSWVEAYIWPEALMTRIRTEAAAAQSIPVEDRSWEELQNALCRIPLDDDEAMKLAVIRLDVLKAHFNVPKDPGAVDANPPTRMEVVKRIAATEIQKRVSRYPNGHLAAVKFTTWPEVVLPMQDNSPEAITKAINTLEACGGTKILAALKLGIDLCQADPSPVGVHHFILVTDGEDAVARLSDWVPVFKASGVVLDYIHIGDSEPNIVIKQVCAATGGEYVVVNTVRDLERKFVAAVERKCLPPAV